MSKEFNERYLQIFNLLSGLLVVSLAFIILVFSIINVIELLLIHAIAILTVGIAKLINSLVNKKLVLGLSIWKFAIGLIIIFLAVMVILDGLVQPLIFTIEMFTSLFGFAFILIGIEQSIKGIVTKDYLNWYRIILIIVGVFNLILSFSIIFIYNIKILEIILVSIILMANGIIRIILGVIGTD
jgi:hypothetical protein